MRIYRSKTFSFSIVRGPVAVRPVVATDYSGAESDAFRDQFKPLAARYRRRLRRTGWSMAGAVALFVALGFLLPNECTIYCFLGGVSSFLLIGVIGWPVLPPCPACHNPLDTGLGMFCPECGSPSLQPGGWFKPPKCGACGKWMNTNKGRHYKIRNCTHCGLRLDEKGL
jgi:hypothetical protein